MSIELLFYTQLISIVGYIVASLFLYRLLVAQKDASIELLKQRNESLAAKISDLETQSPDVLVNALSKRVEVAKSEIEELGKDGALHKAEISLKERELNELRKKLDALTNVLKDSDLVCPHCQAPLVRRGWHTVYAEMDGREVEADIEYVEYACGYATSDDRSEPVAPCGASGAEP